MPYDPSLPVDGSPIVAVELRNQFEGLREMIESLPNSSDVDQAIQGNSGGNCDNVDFLNLTAGNPPTQAQVQAIANKIDELLHALKRQ